MKKNLTYRDTLLELSRIYKINDIQDYIKRKKNLTTSQIEHILKKNNVPIPKDHKISFFEKNLFKPLNRYGNNITLNYQNFKKNLAKSLYGLWAILGKIGIGFLNTFPKLGSHIGEFLSSLFIDTLNSIYNTKFEQKKLNKIIERLGIATIVIAIAITSYTVFSNLNNKEIIETKKINKIDKKKIIKKDEPELKEKKDKIVKLPEKKVEEKLKKKDPSQVSELVLPNLNLKTATVLNLFDDVEYDLKKVRFNKRVKPIYFTQFPKDLDEIKDVQLKKETFIKIVLPLVVAENEKILEDRNKLKIINKKDNMLKKDKLWLNQKFREYKVAKKNIKELEKRMDIIPVSIALAQAAKESGWGTSRFALEGNAIFGQWTWTGQGIAPLDRENNEAHKILRFPILRASVKAYKNNLNTHNGYGDFRNKRHEMRKKKRPIKGLILTDKLDKYAQTGKEYTLILKQIIKQNNLSDFEAVQLTNSIVKKELNL